MARVETKGNSRKSQLFNLILKFKSPNALMKRLVVPGTGTLKIEYVFALSSSGVK